jgi:hypothetical protein
MCKNPNHYYFFRVPTHFIALDELEHCDDVCVGVQALHCGSEPTFVLTCMYIAEHLQYMYTHTHTHTYTQNIKKCSNNLQMHLHLKVTKNASVWFVMFICLPVYPFACNIS